MRIRVLLGDAEALRSSDDLLDESIRWALAVYARSLPQVKTALLTVSQAGR